MQDRVRRGLEAGKHALDFGRAHPDPSAGFATAQTRLEEGVTKGDVLAAQQRAGVIAVRAANARKHAVKERLLHPILDHVLNVAVAASRELPGLERKFQLPRDDDSYHAFRVAVGAMAEEAKAQKDLLVRHGLSEPLLESFTQAIAELDQAAEEAAAGRRAHVGASAELKAVVAEVLQMVHVMDGLNRFRFVDDAELFAAWESASNVVAVGRAVVQTPKPEGGATPPAAGQTEPAA